VQQDLLSGTAIQYRSEVDVQTTDELLNVDLLEKLESQIVQRFRYAAYANPASYSGSFDSSSNFVVCSVTLSGSTISAVSLRAALKTEAGTLCDVGNAVALMAVPN
jgi:hypothetical protein